MLRNHILKTAGSSGSVEYLGHTDSFFSADTSSFSLTMNGSFEPDDIFVTFVLSRMATADITKPPYGRVESVSLGATSIASVLISDSNTSTMNTQGHSMTVHQATQSGSSFTISGTFYDINTVYIGGSYDVLTVDEHLVIIAAIRGAAYKAQDRESGLNINGTDTGTIATQKGGVLIGLGIGMTDTGADTVTLNMDGFSGSPEVASFVASSYGGFAGISAGILLETETKTTTYTVGNAVHTFGIVSSFEPA